MQYNQDKDTSTDEVQTENKRIPKKNPTGTWMFVLRVLHSRHKETNKDKDKRTT